jgi:hypothetical protein
MQTSKLVRTGGTAGVLAAVLWVASSLVHPRDENLADLASGRWVPAHLGYLVALCLSAVLLVGWHLRQAERSGAAGIAGLVIALSGIVLTGGAIALESLGGRVLVTRAPALVTGGTHAPFFQAGLVSSYTLVSGLVTLAGFVVFAVVTWRAGILPRWAGVLVPVGLVLVAGVPGGVLPIVGFVVMSAGFAWLGTALRSTEAEAVSSGAEAMFV